jgi:hypothetical protein
MAGIFVDEGFPDIGDALVNYLNSGDFAVGLFQNNITPDSDTVWTDLTAATFSGFAEQTLAGCALLGIVTHVEQIESGPYVFTHSGGATNNDIYGYYCRNTVTGNLLVAQRKTGAAFPMNAAGLSYTVDILWGLRDILNA